MAVPAYFNAGGTVEVMSVCSVIAFQSHSWVSLKGRLEPKSSRRAGGFGVRMIDSAKPSADLMLVTQIASAKTAFQRTFLSRHDDEIQTCPHTRPHGGDGEAAVENGPAQPERQ